MTDQDELLQKYLELLEAGVPLDEVLGRLPPDASNLKSMLTLVSTLRALPPPPETAAFYNKERQYPCCSGSFD